MTDKVAAARRAIYQLGKSIRSTAVEDLLKSFSGVPTMVRMQNAMTHFLDFLTCY
jgi:hypothetical protein